MKKTLLTLLALSLIGLTWGQDSVRSLRVYRSGAQLFGTPVSHMDSIKFSGSNAIFNYSGSHVYSHAMSDIDSITFRYATGSGGDESSGDTTAVDTAQCIRITWNGSNATVVNPWSSRSVAISNDNGHVSVTSTADTADLVYLLSGSSDDGSLALATDRKLILLLDGVSLTNPAGSALAVSGDKRATLHLAAGTVSVLSDGTAGSNKGTLQCDGRFEAQGSGVLQVYGQKKHGIQSSGSFTMLNGTLQVLFAAQDGMNVDNFVMYGGNVYVTDAAQDGVDADQGYILLGGGTVAVSSSANGASGLCCDSVLQIAGGNLTVTMGGDDCKGLKSGMESYVTGGTTTLIVSGSQSKAIKSKADFTMTGGTIDITASGSVALTASGSGYDPSYCTGIKGDANVTVTGGNLTVSCPAANAGGKAISADGIINIAGGHLSLSAMGSSATYTDADGTTDYYAPACLTSDTSIYLNGGVHTLTSTGRTISTDANMVIDCDSLTLTNSGTGYTIPIGSSGTSATDGFAPTNIKADGNLTVIGGIITSTSTGKGGRGIVVDGIYRQGDAAASNDLLHLHVYTTGAPVNTVSGGMGGRGGSSTDYFKGLPKGLKVEDSLLIRSGNLSVYCSQANGDPTAEAIESKGAIIVSGGNVEANSYDDAINAGTYLEISGGQVWAYGRGNDGIDNNGMYTLISGGTVVAQSGSETGIDASADNGGHFNISAGATVVAIGGNMGCWDNPTIGGGQKYLSLTSANATNGFCAKDASGTEAVIFKSTTSTSGSNFQNLPTSDDGTDYGTGTKPPGGGGGGGGSNGGIAVTAPSIVSGSYSIYSTITLSGGTNWHGLYSGTTCTTSGTATSTTAQ